MCEWVSAFVCVWVGGEEGVCVAVCVRVYLSVRACVCLRIMLCVWLYVHVNVCICTFVSAYSFTKRWIIYHY